MDRQSSGTKSLLGFIRSLSPTRFAICCLLCHALVLVPSVFIFVIRPRAELLSARHEWAAKASAREAAVALKGRIRSAMTELHQYGPNLEQRTSVTKDILMNRLFDEISAIAREVKAPIRLFDRAGHGSGLEGFARITLDTNFLQMTSFLTALTGVSLPIKVEEFHVSHEREDSDTVTFSIAFSLYSVPTLSEPQCSQ